jgi:hypothetical protein
MFHMDHDFLKLTVPHLISQCELNDVVRDLSLLKIQAELLDEICYSKVLNKCHTGNAINHYHNFFLRAVN